MTVPVPNGEATVAVSIIDPNEVIGVPARLFLTPQIEGTAYSNTPCLCFYIEHKDVNGKVTRLLFDLGIRKDWKSSPPTVVNAVESMGVTINTKHDVPELLRQHDVEPASIDHIILSHGHFDHVGDINLFPPSVGVVVGPGFQSHLLPGYPEVPDSALETAAFTGRKLTELNFAAATQEIASLQTLDWFGDGSFFLLETPGHAVGHISALARTTTAARDGGDTFLLLSGDCCHHAGELRPHERCPLPTGALTAHADLPCDTYLSTDEYVARHPLRCLDRPFFSPAAGGFNMDAAQMRRTLDEGIAPLDADPRVLVIPAHEHWLLDVVEFFPSTANDWREKKWKEKAKWRFLQDFT
ncbi:putative N-acyl homoserine lactonase AttM [Dissoconium aciculare CBS 342.82]|uniref:N-acyl homoserine lactonase AttM n=1 Tax=Dissoconium aciculare CBS 342.82 TaxID=1314786 RepID=A0A6J3LSN0_9PEZI|nr:putative N-acyl homoserine lactonase AttM [Dissoconium aciculare CBS 342.82]KAF1818299.1 putative N-acyl homoserine lactonase AttM [Dissoconium aciculare CBS 342.82]